MSYDLSAFWNGYVVAIVICSILGCALLLFVQSKATFTENQETGHKWDETLQEYNNPMPKWWMWLFTLTIIFGLVYLTLYPGLGNYAGQLGWTSAKQLEKEIADTDAKIKPMFENYLKTDIKELAKNTQAMETGKRLFQTYCMQCHGANATGTKGFPNLADNDWLFGGEPEQIKETIANGRVGIMPPYGGGEALSESQVSELVNYVRSLSGMKHDANLAAAGKPLFEQGICVACHQPGGVGMIGLAPNLTDQVWLYGSSEKAIAETIVNGRNNRMPAWQEFLGDEKVHLLTAYVYSLSNNK